MRFALLGPVAVSDQHDRALPMGGPKQRAVLAMLALTPRRAVSTRALVAGVWGDAAGDRAARTLSVYVSNWRKALEPDRVPGRLGRIQTTPTGYLLGAADSEVDAVSFEQLLATGLRALSADRPHEAVDSLRGALALWRGDPLGGLAELPFAAAVTSRLEVLHLDAVQARFDGELAAGNHRAVVAELVEVVDQHPLRERFWAQLMLALYRDGRQAEALETFARARTVLADEAGLDPSPELRELEARILDQDRALRPSPPRTKLGPVPVPMTEMIGRDALLATLLHDIGANRLVTLLGPGGVGKTRLALAAAAAWGSADHQVAFADAAWGSADHQVAFADAARAEDRAGLRLALMSALDIGQSGDDAADFAAANRELLLVCDNVEQVVDGVDLLMVLLQAAPAIRVLVTSRVRLELPGERLVEVPPLPVDGGDDGPSEAAAVAAPGAAVELFLRRARETAPAVELTGTQLRDVVALARALDGLPLALELAAARIRTFSPAQIHSRLAEMATEEVRRRGAPAHQGSLRATVDWSLRLLSAGARHAFARLWVFNGGFTLEAAERVACDPTDESPASKWLSELVEASLLQPVEGKSGRRFVMFETIRLRSRSLADDSSELQRRLAEYLIEIASPDPAVMYGPESARIHLELGDELPNWISAVEWAVRAAPEMGLRLIVAWRPVWNDWSTGMRPLERALSSLSAAAGLDEADRSLAALIRAVPLYLSGALSEARRQLEVEVPTYSGLRPADDCTVRGWCWLAATRCEGGDQVAAVDAAALARRAADLSGYDHLRSTALDLSAWVAVRGGDHQTAREFAEESIRIDRRRDDAVSAAFGHRTLGDVLVEIGDDEELRTCAEHLLAEGGRSGMPGWLELAGLRLLALAGLRRGDLEIAAGLLAQVLTSCDRRGVEGEIVELLWIATAILERSRHRDGAEQLYRAASQLSDRVGYAATTNSSVVWSACAGIVDRLPANFAAGGSWARTEVVPAALGLLAEVRDTVAADGEVPSSTVH